MDLDALHDALRPQARGNSITYPSVERCVLASGGTMKEFMDAFLDGRLEEMAGAPLPAVCLLLLSLKEAGKLPL